MLVTWILLLAFQPSSIFSAVSGTVEGNRTSSFTQSAMYGSTTLPSSTNSTHVTASIESKHTRETDVTDFTSSLAHMSKTTEDLQSIVPRNDFTTKIGGPSSASTSVMTGNSQSPVSNKGTATDRSSSHLPSTPRTTENSQNPVPTTNSVPIPESSVSTALTQEPTTFQKNSTSTETPVSPDITHTPSQADASANSPSSSEATHGTQPTEKVQTTGFTLDTMTIPRNSVSTETTAPPDTSFTTATTEEPNTWTRSQTLVTPLTGNNQTTVFSQASTPYPSSTIYTETTVPPDTSLNITQTETSTTFLSSPTSTQGIQATETSQTVLTEESITFRNNSISTETAVFPDTSLSTALTDVSPAMTISTKEAHGTGTSQTMFTPGSTTFSTSSWSTERAGTPEASYTSAENKTSTPSPSTVTSTQATQTIGTSQTVFTQESTTFLTESIPTETAVSPQITHTTSLSEASTTSPGSPISTQETQPTETPKTIFTQEATTYPTSTISTETAVPPHTSPSTALTDTSSTLPSTSISTQETQATETSRTGFTQEPTILPRSSTFKETVVSSDTPYTSAVNEASPTSPSNLISTKVTLTTETPQTVFIQEATTFLTILFFTEADVHPEIITYQPEGSATPLNNPIPTPGTQPSVPVQTTVFPLEIMTSQSSPISTKSAVSPEISHTSTLTEASATSSPSSPTSTQATQATETSPTVFTRESPTFPSSGISTDMGHPPMSFQYTILPAVFSLPSSSEPSSAFTTLPPKDCKNGKWNGRQCECRPGYTGQLCDSTLYSFPVEIPDVIHATVTVLVKVTERNITADMRNASSQAYKNFSDLFVSQMNKVYKGDDLPQYKEVIIRELLNGSIVVDNGVVLEAKYTPEYKTVFRNATEIVKDKIMNETSTIATDLYQCRYHILCYNGNFTTVDEDSLTFSFDPAEYCFQNAAKDFGHYFYPEDLDGTLTCVNNCTQGTKSQVNCSPGYCQLLHSGPQCVCPNTDTHWYWGKTCESRTSKRLVYGLVGTVLALLLVLVITLAVILSCSQRRKHRSTYDLSQARQREALPGTFQSTGVWEADSLKEEMYGLEKGYSHFRPNLENVDLKTKV